MVIRLTIVCVRYNVTMEILCHKDTECIVSDETIEIKATSDIVGSLVFIFLAIVPPLMLEYREKHRK